MKKWENPRMFGGRVAVETLEDGTVTVSFKLPKPYRPPMPIREMHFGLMSEDAQKLGETILVAVKDAELPARRLVRRVLRRARHAR